MEVRKATKKDLETITKIAVEGEIDEEKMQYSHKTKAQIRKYINPKKFRRDLIKELNERKRYFLVIEIDNEVIIFGQAYLKKKGIGEIGRVYIKKEFRNKGIGTKLIKHLIDFLKKKKVKEIESYAYTKNKPSLRVHEKLGFKKEAYKLVLKLN